jgi:folate-binding protein YgfZ
MDDVELEVVSQDFEHHALEGPHASELLRAILNKDAPSNPFEIKTIRWRGENLWWIRKNELTDQGFEIIVPVLKGGEFRDELAAKGNSFGMQEIGPAAHNLLRLEKGIPLYGVDFSSKNNPVEARLTEAYSLTKGCYVGQEVVSKATRVGSVPKALVRLKIPGKVVPEVGSPLVTREGQEIGRITSAVFSLMLKHPIALAFVKKGFWTPGSIHQIVISSTETQSGEIVERFV